MSGTDANSFHWEVALQGRQRDLELLARHFTAGRVRVAEDQANSCFVLQMKDFEDCTTSEAVAAVEIEEVLPARIARA